MWANINISSSEKSIIPLFMVKLIHIFSIVWIIYFFKVAESFITTWSFILFSFIYIIILILLMQYIIKRNESYILIWLASIILNFWYLCAFYSTFL